MSAPSRRSSFRLPSELRGPLLAGCLLFVGSWLFLSFVPFFEKWLYGDVRLYENWANMITGRQLPYRDFRIEYPPLALPVLALPVYARKLVGYHGTYYEWFRVELLVIGLATQVALVYALAALRATRRHAYLALAIAGIGPALLGPIALARYDYWPTLLAVAAVAALAARRPTLACALAGAGAAAKVFPAILVPLALVELWRRGGLRAAARGVAVAAAAVAAFVVPFLAAGGSSGLVWALRRQIERPLQVESLAAVFFGIAHAFGDAHVRVVKSAGSDNLVGAGPDLASTLLGIAGLLALLAVYVLYARSRGTREQLVAAAVAALTGYIAFSKVFSPQYLVWLIPLVPLVRSRAAQLLALAAVGLTQIWEPYRYVDYYKDFPAGLTLLVLVRDLLVVALFAVLLRSVRDAKELRGERPPVV